MTSPGPDDTTRRLTRAATATGADKPQLAFTLANSDLSNSEIDAVGGFAQAMQVSVARRLAANSGARAVGLTTQEKNSQAAIGEDVPEAEQPDSRSWFEKATDWVAGALSNTGNALVHNPLSDKIFEGLNFLGDVAHLPFRLLSDGLDQGNNDEIDREMLARGYDPDSTASYLAFMFHQGESQYHSLDGLRDAYGDSDVELAVRMQADPEQFQKDLLGMDKDKANQIQEKINGADFQHVFDAVNRQHISPGRDLARVLLLGHTDNAAFTGLSGALDGAYDWFSDPTLILGKGVQTARAMDALTGATEASMLRPSTWVAKALPKNWRAGVSVGDDALVDQSGVRALLRTEGGRAVTKVGKGWERFISDAADWRKANEAGDAKKATGIWSVMQQRYGSMMSLFDEVNGAHVIADAGELSGFRIERLTESALGTNGKAITDLDTLSDHLTSTNGLLRINNGWAAQKELVMPGRLSWRAERTAADEARTITGRNKAKKTTRWIDYSRPDQLLPNPKEQALLDRFGDTETVRAGLAQNRQLLRSSITSARSAAARFERVGRRFRTQIPSVDHVDLYDSNSPKLVEQVARTYMNRGDAARVASAYQAGDVAARRAIVRGVLDQSFHASGLSKSEAGRSFMNRYLGDQAALEKQKYGYGDTSTFQTARGEVEGAMYPDQLSRFVLIPSFREMNHLAAKFAVGGFAGRTGLAHVRALSQGPGMDALMGRIKLGWITSAAGGLRNALDEIANFAAYGTLGDVAAARVAFTRATTKSRILRREAARRRLDMISQYGRAEADDRIATQLGGNIKGYEEAQRALESSRNAEAAVADVESKLKQRVTDAHTARAEAYTYRYRALSEHEAGKKAGLPEEELSVLRDRAQYWSDEAAKAEGPASTPGTVKFHEKAYADRQAKIDEVRQTFADRGVVPVGQAERDLARAKREMEDAQRLQVAISHRLPYFARIVGDKINDKLVGVVLGKVMSVMGKGWMFDDQHVAWARELIDPELQRVARDGVYQAHQADAVLMDASDHTAMDYHRAGLMARRYSFRPNGWGMVEADGGAGLDAWANTLRLRFSDTASPAHSWVQTMAALYKPGMSHAEWETAYDAARDSVLTRIGEDDLRHFVNQAEIFHWYKGAPVGDDETLQQLAREEYADRVATDLTQALSKRGGGLNTNLVKEIAEGRVPDRSWLAQNVATADRPAHAIGQLWAPYNPAHAPGQFAAGYAGMLSKSYEKVVTDQINALSRNPLMAALYMRTRERTLGFVEGLVNGGWDREIADDLGKRLALKQAEAEAFRHIDNPYVSSQFSLVSRNLWAFVRAQEDWLKRWGRTVKDNPQLIRQAQLLIHGGEATGILERDPNDPSALHFVYPGSGLMMGVLQNFLGALGQDNMAQIPVTGELTSQLTMLNPSLDNPMGFSGTPLISLPWKAIGHFLGPENSLFEQSMDKVINGELGAGREWWEQLFPATVNRIIHSVVESGDNSQLGQGMKQAMAQMSASGQLDDRKYQTPEGQNELLHRLRVGTHNNMFMNVVLGFVLPASPQYNVTGDKADAAEGHQGDTPDFSAHLTGLASLKDEAREVFSKLPYEEALAWWQKVHPGELVYAQSGMGAQTVVGSKSASAPATLAAVEHMQHNWDFYQKYGGKGGLAAYFIPQGPADTANGTYSPLAYRAQLELGIRDYKTLSEYLDDLVTQRGMDEYFTAKDAHDNDVAGTHSPSVKRQLDAAWAEQKARLQQANPLLTQKLASYAQDNAIGGETIARLHELVRDTDPATIKALGPNREAVAALLAAQDDYSAVMTKFSGRNGNAATRQKDLARTTYDETVKAIATQYPGVADLARGVFRLPS